MPQDKLAAECGFTDIVPRTWVGPVNALDAASGRFIGADAMWMEEAEGISLESLVQYDVLDREATEELLLRKCVA